MQEKFDAIVVGAGPSGSACALTMARAGLKVLLIERGRFPGEKNVSGGVIYGQILNELVPEFWNEAPVERHIKRRIITFLTEESGISLTFESSKFDSPPYLGFSILRAKFDRWLAQKAVDAGAILATELLVENLIIESGQVVGVKVGGDEIRSNVVVAADGVLSKISQQAGLRKEIETSEVSLGIKEVLKLPKETIEERFSLDNHSGFANEFVGKFTKNVQGGGFLYSNLDSLSLGIIVQAQSLINSQQRIIDLLTQFKEHSTIAPLIRGATPIEYSAHLIPENGLAMSPKFYSDGILVVGDAAGFVLAAGIILEGNNFALASGMIAGQAIQMANAENDFSAKSLSRYSKLLEKSFVTQDLQTFRNAPGFLSNPRLYSLYPEIICDTLEHFLDPKGKPRKPLWKVFREETKGRISLWNMITDGIKGARAL